MRNAQVVLDRDFVVADTDPRLCGAFIEHIGRCVYGGIFEPGHPSADARGFRQDVMTLVRELAPTIMRNPVATSSPATTGKTESVPSKIDRVGWTTRGCPLS